MPLFYDFIEGLFMQLKQQLDASVAVALMWPVKEAACSWRLVLRVHLQVALHDRLEDLLCLVRDLI